MKKLIPLLDQVLVKQHDAKKTLGSLGLSMPESDQRKPNTGTVIRAAEGTTFKSGDVIVFDQHANPMNVTEEDNEYVLISSTKIFAKMESI